MIFALTMFFVGLIAGFEIGYLGKHMLNSFRAWRVSRRKFTCGVCKKRKRAKKGYMPVAVDIEYGDMILPLSTFLCKDCTGDA